MEYYVELIGGIGLITGHVWFVTGLMKIFYTT